jgi:hypothetical protein
MSRIIVAGLVFVAVFVGLGLAVVGVPSAYAIACGFAVTGVALFVAGRQPQFKEGLPVNLIVVGVVFVGIGALLAAAGACSSDSDSDSTRVRTTPGRLTAR